MSKQRADADRELSAINSSGVGLRVVFKWRGDRFGHQVETVDGARTRTVLESVEGDDESIWPPSPPLQNVNVSLITSDTEQGHVALLLGGAGKSQWSMCVSARDGVKDVSDKAAGTELLFDIACRVQAQPAFLGSTYSTLQQQIAVSDNLNGAFVPSAGPGIVIVPQDAELEIEGKRTLAPILRCKAANIQINELPTTLRWRYSIQRTTGGPPFDRNRNLLHAIPRKATSISD